jgi:hypothetical protein
MPRVPLPSTSPGTCCIVDRDRAPTECAISSRVHFSPEVFFVSTSAPRRPPERFRDRRHFHLLVDGQAEADARSSSISIL